MTSQAFFYGLDDQDEFEGQLDWHPPGKAEDRIDELFLPYTQKLGRKIDMIQLHSGSTRRLSWTR